MNDKTNGVKPPKQTANPSAKTKLEAIPAKNHLERKPISIDKTETKPRRSRLRPLMKPPQSPKTTESASQQNAPNQELLPVPVKSALASLPFSTFSIFLDFKLDSFLLKCQKWGRLVL